MRVMLFDLVKIAILNAATYIGQDKNLGSIQRGKLADLLLLRADPTTRSPPISSRQLMCYAYLAQSLLGDTVGSVGLESGAAEDGNEEKASGRARGWVVGRIDRAGRPVQCPLRVR